MFYIYFRFVLILIVISLSYKVFRFWGVFSVVFFCGDRIVRIRKYFLRWGREEVGLVLLGGRGRRILFLLFLFRLFNNGRRSRRKEAF